MIEASDHLLRVKPPCINFAVISAVTNLPPLCCTTINHISKKIPKYACHSMIANYKHCTRESTRKKYCNSFRSTIMNSKCNMQCKTLLSVSFPEQL